LGAQWGEGGRNTQSREELKIGKTAECITTYRNHVDRIGEDGG